MLCNGINQRFQNGVFMKYYTIPWICFFACINLLHANGEQPKVSIALHMQNQSGAKNLYQADDESRNELPTKPKLEPDTNLTQFMIVNFIKYNAVKVVIASPAGIPYLVNRLIIYPFFSTQPWIDEGSPEEQKSLEENDQKKVPEIIAFPLIYYLRKKIF